MDDVSFSLGAHQGRPSDGETSRLREEAGLPGRRRSTRGCGRHWQADDTIARTDSCRFSRSKRRFWQLRGVTHSVLANSRDPRETARTTLKVSRYLVVRADPFMSHATPTATSDATVRVCTCQLLSSGAVRACNGAGGGGPKGRERAIRARYRGWSNTRGTSARRDGITTSPRCVMRQGGRSCDDGRRVGPPGRCAGPGRREAYAVDSRPFVGALSPRARRLE